jgi:soluble lytic murein transglycosylase-like protein
MAEIHAYLQPLIDDAAARHGLDPYLIGAIVLTESSGQTHAVRYEPSYRWLYKPEEVKPSMSSLETEVTCQKISFGLMQVMGAVAREYGHRGWLTELCRPEVGLEYGCKYFVRLLKRFRTIDAAVSAYNQGSPRRDVKGRYLNEHYVDKVLSLKHQLAGAAR